ncbi:hypothetical protein [Vibrio sp. 10N]|uniref:hypothetical protein n=1 Tax=Vibrio sp. 10N TaxID=3058938 RepID=UPI0028139E40|nr:hypothetical protein VB10N_06380 [Vibrio sp. 10N]
MLEKISHLEIGEPQKFLNFCEIVSCIIKHCGKNSATSYTLLKTIREATLLSTPCKMLNGSNKNNAALISPEALAIKEAGKESNNLILEHGVPVKVIMDKIQEYNEPTPVDIAIIIQSMSALAVITKEEGKYMSKLGIKSKMPDDWDKQNKWIRYERANIQLIPNPYKR